LNGGSHRILFIDFWDAPDDPGRVSGPGLALLRDAEVTRLPLRGVDRALLRERIAPALADVDALVVSPWSQFPYPLTAAELDAAPRLRVIAGTFDNRFANWVDLAELARRGITLIDTSRNMTPSVAEFALAMTLNLLRDIPFLIEETRLGRWQPDGHASRPVADFVHGDLSGKRIALAGFGSINRRYAQLAAPFGVRQMTFDPNVRDQVLAEYGVERCDSLVELARQAEIFVVGIPPTPATLEIISAEVLDALPRGSLFVLVTRMAVVHQPTLWRRLAGDELRAAIDVFEPEPPPADAWFRRHRHCLPTPHIAGGVFYCHERCFTVACRDAIAVLNGGTAEYQATPRDVALYAGQHVGDATEKMERK